MYVYVCKVSKNFFSALRASVWSENKWEDRVPPTGSTTGLEVK